MKNKTETLIVQVQYVPAFKEARLKFREEISGKNWIWETIIVSNEEASLEDTLQKLRSKAFVIAGEKINSGTYKKVEINPFSD